MQHTYSYLTGKDAIITIYSADEELFELACAELANKNSRRILKEIAEGKSTAGQIATMTGLSVQDILNHLRKLESTGLIRTERALTRKRIRGRSPKTYEISKFALVLIPSEIVDKSNFREFLEKISRPYSSRFEY